MKTNTDRTLDVVFSRFRGFSFTITLRQKPKGVTHMLSLCLVIQRGICITPLGFCLGVIVNEKLLNLEMTTSSVLSVLLFIYAHRAHFFYCIFWSILVGEISYDNSPWSFSDKLINFPHYKLENIHIKYIRLQNCCIL